MGSKVDICNTALAHLGQRAVIQSISPPESSYEAQQCARFYPQAVAECLEERNWGFAITRESLAQLSVTPPASWVYAYEIPNLCIRILAVLLPGQTDDNTSEDYIVEGTTIYTNATNATIRFTKLIDDPTLYGAVFTSAVAWLLAHYLAGGIIKGDAGIKASEGAYKAYQIQLGKAAVISGNQAKTSTIQNQQPEFIAARMGTGSNTSSRF